MTDKKFTDEEIVKALEDYIKENEFEYFHSNMMGEYPLIKKSLNIINRQKSEIERLNGALIHALSELSLTRTTLIDAKIKAYKEFAAVMKKNIKELWDYDNGTFCPVYVLAKPIDNLLKEMVAVARSKQDKASIKDF